MRRLSGKAAPLAAITALAAMSLTACSASSAATSANIGAATGKPVTVGISLPLTGQFSADGVASEQGYQLWASDVNSHGGLLGHPVKLVIRDDASDPNKTAADYQTLITKDKVDLTLAPFSSLLTVSAAPVTDKYHYAIVAGSAGAPSVYGLHSHYLFSTNVPVQVQMVPFAKWVTSLTGSERPLSAAYAIVQDPFAAPPITQIIPTLTAHGIRNALQKSIPENANGSVSVSTIKADADKIAASGAQMVLLGTVDVPSVSAFLNEFIAKHYTPKIIIASAGPDQGTAFLHSVGVSNAVGIMVPNGWYGGYPNALSHVMVQDYIAKYGGDASAINADVAEAYSAGQVLAAGVDGTGGTSNPAIAAYLHKTTVQTVLGPVRFDSSGENLDAQSAALIFQWQANAHFVQVLPVGSPGSVPIDKQWAG